MGNRASVIFYDTWRVSPTVYLHWHGEAVPAWLQRLKRLMEGRFDDAEYAAARFVGLCNNQIEGNLSLGVSSNAISLPELSDPSLLEDLSPGDAGIVLVDTRDFSWRAFGGYLSNRGRD